VTQAAQLSTMALFSHLSGVEREPAAGVAAPAQERTGGEVQHIHQRPRRPLGCAPSGRARTARSRPPFDLFTEVNKYSLYDVVDKISTPLLTTDPEQDEFFSGRPRDLFHALTCEKRLVPFTAEQGAAGHCEPLTRSQVSLVMNDWSAEHLAGQ
jgi:hypothetical protein